jgi:hypothetical protein
MISLLAGMCWICCVIGPRIGLGFSAGSVACFPPGITGRTVWAHSDAERNTAHAVPSDDGTLDLRFHFRLSRVFMRR